MDSLLDEEIERYVEAHTTPEDELFTRLRVETEAAFAEPQMQVGPVEGRLLRLLVMISGARRVLEIGTFSGYSALALASGLPADGELLTLDVDAEATAVARRYFDESPWGRKIRLRLGPALATLRELAAGGASFDLVFIDADKESYVDYWEAVVPLVPPGGLILADNALWSGRVLAPQEETDRAVAAFNARVRGDARVEHVLLSIRDGVMLARKR
jgi:caffeoyl-CoA O-methyltransferase